MLKRSIWWICWNFITFIFDFYVWKRIPWKIPCDLYYKREKKSNYCIFFNKRVKNKFSNRWLKKQSFHCFNIASTDPFVALLQSFVSFSLSISSFIVSFASLLSSNRNLYDNHLWSQTRQDYKQNLLNEIHRMSSGDSWRMNQLKCVKIKTNVGTVYSRLTIIFVSNVFHTCFDWNQLSLNIKWNKRNQNIFFPYIFMRKSIC